MQGLPFEDRKRILLRHPRVKFAPGRNVCDGYRWARIPGKALWNHNGTRADPTLKEKYRCRKPAHYNFTAVSNCSDVFDATSGTYCWPHLVSQIDSMTEWHLFVKWWDKQPEVVALRYAHGEY